MDVNFEYYKIFYYAAKYNNFTRAARVLGKSQPNVTRAMNCLEQQLHCTLLVRTNRGVFLTTEGEKLYTHVAAAMEQLFTAEEELAECVGLSHGSIAIGASETALNLFLLDKLKEFHNTYPGIRLKIYNHSTPQAVEAVRRGTVDFAVVSTPVKADAPLHMTMLHPYQEILIGGTEFGHLAGKQTTFEEIMQYPLICLGKETVTFQFYRQLFASYGLDFEPDTETATADQILPLVRSGLGLAFIPKPMAKDAIDRGEVSEIPLCEKIPSRNICLIYDSTHPFKEAATQLKKMIAANSFASVE